MRNQDLEKIKLKVINKLEFETVKNKQKINEDLFYKLSKDGIKKDRKNIIDFIDLIFEVLEDKAIEIDNEFIPIIEAIFNDFVNLLKKLSLLKLASEKDSINKITKFLDDRIAEIKENKEIDNLSEQRLNELMKLIDKNYFDADKIESDEQKEEIETIIQKFNPVYKLDKISIIESLKNQIKNFHQQKNQNVTIGYIKQHTINSIIFAYKDFYNFRIIPKDIKKELVKNSFSNTKIMDNSFFILVSKLKLNRSGYEPFNLYNRGDKISKKDFKHFECYLFFDSITILEYSSVQFLGRKLLVFFDNPERQSEDFGKLKEEIKKNF